MDMPIAPIIAPSTHRWIVKLSKSWISSAWIKSIKNWFLGLHHLGCLRISSRVHHLFMSGSRVTLHHLVWIRSINFSPPKNETFNGFVQGKILKLETTDFPWQPWHAMRVSSNSSLHIAMYSWFTHQKCDWPQSFVNVYLSAERLPYKRFMYIIR